MRTSRTRPAGVVAVALLATGCGGGTRAPSREVRFEKLTLDASFRSEGVAVADVNRDGKLDLLAGDLWYEAPDWTPRAIAPVRPLDPYTEYSDAFIVFADDVNGDGWIDELVFGFPGAAPSWRENPRGAAGPWLEWPIAAAASNESPAFAPLDGARVLVFQSAGTRMAWFEPNADLAQPFVEHPINDAATGATTVPGHSLGVGDVDGDGLADVVISKGWWRAPDWRWNPSDLGPDCAQMYVFDVNGDGRNDVVSSSAHGVGIWWYEQTETGAFVQHLIDDSFSQSHALVAADVNGDGLTDLVTGKRLWAHGPTGDVDPDGLRVLHWFELQRTGNRVTWVRHLIDDASGVGTQFEVTDVNGDGRVDIAVSNKTGVHLFLQRP